MNPTNWTTVCAAASEAVSLQQLDDQLERIPHLTEDERSAIWLYAWAARDSARRVAALAA
jgi:hypothetical protein